MTVIKLTKSGKALQVITDEGKVYICPKYSVESLLVSQKKFNVVKMTRLPFNVGVDRFGVSEVWYPEGVNEVDREKIGREIDAIANIRRDKDDKWEDVDL